MLLAVIVGKWFAPEYFNAKLIAGIFTDLERTQQLKAKQLPNDIKDAFIDALESWNSLEYQLFMIYQFLDNHSHLDLAWSAFVEIGTISAQRKKVTNLAKNLSLSAEDANVLDGLLKRMKKLSRKRNALVHGRWSAIHVETVDEVENTIEHSEEVLRLYDSRNPDRDRPSNVREEDALLGKSRFNAAEMLKATREFNKLSIDMIYFIESLIKYSRLVVERRN